jgi:hypothetical protein
MRESMPDKTYAELAEMLGYELEEGSDVDERVYKAVEVFPRTKSGPWVVADPFGKEWEYGDKSEAVQAGRELAQTENWGFAILAGKVASESVEEGADDELDEASTVMRQTTDGSKVPGGKPGVQYFRFMSHARSAQWSKLTKVVTAWYVEDAHPKKVQKSMQDSFKRAVQTWERSGRFPSGSDIEIEESVASNKRPVKLGPIEKEVMRVARSFRTQKFTAAECQAASKPLGKLSTTEIGAAIDVLIRKGMLAGANDYFSILGEDVDEGAVAAKKHREMMAGKKVVVSDDDMEALEQMPNANYLASVPNPKQVGTKDKYLAYYKNKVRESEDDVDEGKKPPAGSWYVKWSSIFDNPSNKYDIPLFTRTLKAAGMKKVWTDNAYGWDNQPKVVLFQGDAAAAQVALDALPVFKKWGAIVSDARAAWESAEEDGHAPLDEGREEIWGARDKKEKAAAKKAAAKKRDRETWDRHNKDATAKRNEDDVDEAMSVKTGNPEVPEVGYSRGEYWYRTKSGLKNVTGPKPAERKKPDVRSILRERFRQALANTASLGGTVAGKLIKQIDAQVPEDVEEQLDERETLQFPESKLETYVLAAQAAGIADDDPCFVHEDGVFTVAVPTAVAPRFRQMVRV